MGAAAATPSVGRSCSPTYAAPAMTAMRTTRRRMITTRQRVTRPHGTGTGARLHVFEEVDPPRYGDVAHRRVDVQDRFVRTVVAGAHAVDAEVHRLHQRLALERAGHSLAARHPRRRGPGRVHEAADRRVLEDGYAEHVLAAARQPDAV